MKIIRYILFLPVALGASIVIGAAGHWLGSFGIWPHEGGPVLAWMLSGLGSAIAFVFVGLKTAPEPTRGVKLILAAILIFLGAMSALGPLLAGIELVRCLAGLAMIVVAIGLVGTPTRDIVGTDSNAFGFVRSLRSPNVPLSGPPQPKVLCQKGKTQMTTVNPDKKKFSPIGWIAMGIVALVFVGARQLHPGGIRGLVGDFITSAQTSPEVQTFHDKMLMVLKPIGAGGLCLKENSDDASLRNAIKNYSLRNEAAMNSLIASVDAAGGMSKAEKDLLNRQAFREARRFIGNGHEMERVCGSLAKRLNSGEYDIK